MLEGMVEQSGSQNELRSQFVRLLHQLTGASAILWFTTNAVDELSSIPECTWPESIPDPIVQQLRALADRSRATGTSQLAQARDDAARIALAVPVFRTDGVRDALVLLLEHAGDEPRLLTSILQSVQFAAAWVTRVRFGDASLGDDRQTKRFQTLLSKLAQADRTQQIQQAAEVAATHLSEQLGARWVAIGFRGTGGVCRLCAISNRLVFQRGAPLVNSLESVLTEAMLPSSITPQPSFPDDATVRPTESVAKLAQLTEAKRIVHLPLFDGGGQMLGAAVAVMDDSIEESSWLAWQASSEIWGPRLASLRQAQQGVARKAGRWYRALEPAQRRRLWFAIAGVFALLVALPIPHRVKARCEVQAISRRYVAAPYEGRLEKALVEPGDLVEAGQVLARMDGREIRLELSGLEAESGRVAKERDLALASGETSDAQIAELEMARLQVKTQLLRDQLANLEVRSPSAGVVISGDPQKLEGARLSMGQTLLEVGPLGQMMVEVAIPDTEIAHVELGMGVSMSLDAMPRHTFRGELVRIHPRAEQRNQENIFLGEVMLRDDAQVLLPGMRGRAKVASGYRSLGWVLFHRAIDNFVFRLGW
jgi:multidrug resistance efflux pump